MPHYRLDLYSLDASGYTVVHSYATTGYTTPSTGSPPLLTHIEGRLKHAGNLGRHLYGRGRLIGSGEPNVSTGSFTLENTDGVLDMLQDYSFDGQIFSLSEFDPETGEDAANSPFRSGIIEQPIFSSENEVVIAVRDGLYGYDVPFIQNRYAGTNVLPAGVEGTDDIAGQPKPYCIGQVFNISPVCVNTSKLIYQVDGHRGLVSGYNFFAYDRRVLIPADGAGVYTSQADMEANAPTAGYYRVWPAGGMFRLNAQPGLLTCDVNNKVSGVWQMDFILSEITGRSLTDKTIGGTYNAGIYVREERTRLDVIAELLRSLSAFYTVGSTCDGDAFLYDHWFGSLLSASDHASTFLEVGVPPGPIPLSSVLSIRQERPADVFRGLPVWRVTLNYRKNFTVTSRGNLAPALPSEQELYSKPYQTVTVSDSAVLTQWPNAGELTIDTLLTFKPQVEDEAARLLTLFKTPRRLFAVKVAASEIRDNMPSPGIKERFSLMHRVTLTYPRWGLDSGVTLMVVGIEEDLDADTYDLLLCEVPA